MNEEKDRFYSRLSRIPGIRPMPSVGDWILLQVERPSEMARKLQRRLEPGIVSVPRNVPGALRVTVSDPLTNERLINSLRDICA